MVRLLEKFKDLFKPSKEEVELVEKYNKKVEAKKALTIEDFDAVKKKRNKTLSSNF